jgi:hypothetical protein
VALTRGSMTPISHCFSVYSDSAVFHTLSAPLQVNLPELEMEVSKKVYPWNCEELHNENRILVVGG